MSTFPDVVQALGVNEVGERPIVSVADVQIQLTDTTLAVSPSVSFAPVLLLPSAAAMAGTPAGGKRYRVRDANGNAGTVPITISAPGALIDGAATVQISIAWGVAVIEWVGTGCQRLSISDGRISSAGDHPHGNRSVHNQTRHRVCSGSTGCNGVARGRSNYGCGWAGG